MNIVQMLIIIFAVYAIVKVVLRLRDKSLSPVESFLWAILWVGVIFAAIFPNTLIELSNDLGLGKTLNMLVYLSILLLFYLVFRLYSALDKLDHRFNTLVKELSIERTIKRKKSK
jgi:hypothetical protein